MLLLPLDVIVIIDQCIRPPGPKMVVCIEPNLGLFFRINTRAHWQQSVLLKRSTNTFLHHDSYLECGEPLELDDFIVQESIAQNGVVGRVDFTLSHSIYSIVSRAVTISDVDKDAIRIALGC